MKQTQKEKREGRGREEGREGGREKKGGREGEQWCLWVFVL